MVPVNDLGTYVPDKNTQFRHLTIKINDYNNPLSA